MPGAHAGNIVCYFHCCVISKGGDSSHVTQPVTHRDGKCQRQSKEMGACWTPEPLPSSVEVVMGMGVKEINGSSNTSDLFDNGRTVEDFCTKLYLVSRCDLGRHCA